MKIRCWLAGIAMSLCVAAALAAEPADIDHRLSVKEIMASVIKPATNLLWGIENPRTDEEWAPYEQAAMTVIIAGTVLREGGNGETDPARAASPAWRNYVDKMVDAAVSALKAARARDLNAFNEVTYDALYQPCEKCHIDFAPADQ